MRRDESLLSTAAIAVIAGSTLLTLAGCASAPDPRLASAQAAVQAARDDQLVLAYAPARLAEAEDALQQAEAAAADGAEEQEIDHLAATHASGAGDIVSSVVVPFMPISRLVAVTIA